MFGFLKRLISARVSPAAKVSHTGLRTLILTVDPSFPPVSGSDLRHWQHARSAAQLGPVMLASLRPLRTGAPPGNIRLHSLSDGTDLVWRSDFDLVVTRQMVAALRAIARSFDPHAIVLGTLSLANLVAPAKGLGRHVIIDLQNIESHLVGQSPNASLEVDRIAALERTALVAADRVWVCSREDSALLKVRGLAIGKTDIVPNGIPRPELLPARLPVRRTSDATTLLFAGHLGYEPNVEAARWLVEQMPALVRAVPNARLILAGRRPATSLLQAARPGRIRVVASPESMTPWLRQSDIAVIPLKRGGGTRIKALEAIAWGLPVVATAKAVEGLGLRDGREVILAETRNEFISAVRRLSEQPALYAAQRRNAHRMVMAEYGPTAMAARVRAGLSSVWR